MVLAGGHPMAVLGESVCSACVHYPVFFEGWPGVWGRGRLRAGARSLRACTLGVLSHALRASVQHPGLICSWGLQSGARTALGLSK